MADDDNDKRKKRPGSRPAAARPFTKRGDGKPGFGARPAGGKKPFAKRSDNAGDGPPKRDFKPRGDHKRGGFKNAGAKPFAKRTDRDNSGDGPPKRDFKPRGDRKPGGFKDTGAKHFAKRGDRGERDGADRPPRTFVKRERPEGDRKPFQKREFDDRPGRRERAAGAGSDAPRAEAPFKRSAERPGKPFERPHGERASRPGFDKKPRFEAKPRFEGKRGHGDERRPLAATHQAEDASGERIAKRLARAGIASRRDAEALIADGRVKVNGVVLTSPAFNVSASDRIELDGTEIPPIERTRLFLFHKPAGVVTTNRDPEGRRTVFDVLPGDLPRLVTVGRLDINTEGLLLLTNDGGLARLLELPATGWLRRYRVRVHGKVEADKLDGLKEGIAVDGVFYGGIEATLDREQGSNAWLTIGLREGKNREVKNILGALGLDVNRLIRISYGPFQLGELAEGAVQELKGRMLRDQLGERLIEESGANFEAPVVNPFSNKPVRSEEASRPERSEKPKIVRDGIQGRIGDGGLIKQRRRGRDDDRTSALSRLTTRPDGPKPFAKGGKSKPFSSAGRDRDKPDERQGPSKARTANVWMAPGARPQGKKRVEPSDEPSSRGRGGEKGGKPGSGKGRGGADRRR